MALEGFASRFHRKVSGVRDSWRRAGLDVLVLPDNSVRNSGHRKVGSG